MSGLKWQDISQFENSEHSPGFLLWKTQLIWRRKIERVLSEFELTQPQFVLIASLGYLTSQNYLVSQVKLANLTLMDINTTSQILRNLEKRHLIIRKYESGDEKTKYSMLTKQGYTVLKKAISAVEQFDDNFFGALSKTNFKNMMQILPALITGNM